MSYPGCSLSKYWPGHHQQEPEPAARRPGKAYASFLGWIEQVRQNKRVLVIGPHYVVVSREVWDEMTNKPLGLTSVTVDEQV